MQFISTTFLTFLLIIFLCYHSCPSKYRYILLFVANYVFYGWNNLIAVPTLLVATIISYMGGLILEKKKTRWVYILFFGFSISILVIYKYLNFVLSNLNMITGEQIPMVDILTPVGLSFYVFQSTSYLNDVYRKGLSAEKNIIKYATFVSFFPTVLSGPIQQSRDLLPQISKPSAFSYERAKRGLQLFIWGFFEKMIVANQLAAVVNLVYDNYLSYDNVYYLVAAVCYSIYIYCDFSSYSDMACGVAMLLGFDIKPNFKNPYLAESLSDFWNRWHMSLNTWFVENIYIPLGGNRKGKIRKYFNVFTVFLISGIWHGASWTFIFWGVLNGVLRIIGEILAPFRSRIRETLQISNDGFGIRMFRRCTVFFFITITWVFFRMPDVGTALHIIRNMLIFWPSSIFTLSVTILFGTRLKALLFLVALLIFLFVQYVRKGEGKLYNVFIACPKYVEQVVMAILICCCVFAACSGTATFNTQFIYFQF